jgi:hypothetical protein
MFKVGTPVPQGPQGIVDSVIIADPEVSSIAIKISLFSTMTYLINQIRLAMDAAWGLGLYYEE